MNNKELFALIDYKNNYYYKPIEVGYNEDNILNIFTTCKTIPEIEEFIDYLLLKYSFLKKEMFYFKSIFSDNQVPNFLEKLRCLKKDNYDYFFYEELEESFINLLISAQKNKFNTKNIILLMPYSYNNVINTNIFFEKKTLISNINNYLKNIEQFKNLQIFWKDFEGKLLKNNLKFNLFLASRFKTNIEEQNIDYFQKIMLDKNNCLINLLKTQQIPKILYTQVFIEYGKIYFKNENNNKTDLLNANKYTNPKDINGIIGQIENGIINKLIQGVSCNEEEINFINFFNSTMEKKFIEKNLNNEKRDNLITYNYKNINKI